MSICICLYNVEARGLLILPFLVSIISTYGHVFPCTCLRRKDRGECSGVRTLFTLSLPVYIFLLVLGSFFTGYRRFLQDIQKVQSNEEIEEEISLFRQVDNAFKKPVSISFPLSRCQCMYVGRGVWLHESCVG